MTRGEMIKRKEMRYEIGVREEKGKMIQERVESGEDRGVIMMRGCNLCLCHQILAKNAWAAAEGLSSQGSHTPNFFKIFIV